MNSIKEVLENNGIKQICMSEQLGKNYKVINAFVQNRKQLRLEILFEIANIHKVEVKDLINEKSELL